MTGCLTRGGTRLLAFGSPRVSRKSRYTDLSCPEQRAMS